MWALLTGRRRRGRGIRSFAAAARPPRVGTTLSRSSNRNVNFVTNGFRDAPKGRVTYAVIFAAAGRNSAVEARPTRRASAAARSRPYSCWCECGGGSRDRDMRRGPRQRVRRTPTLWPTRVQNRRVRGTLVPGERIPHAEFGPVPPNEGRRNRRPNPGGRPRQRSARRFRVPRSRPRRSAQDRHPAAPRATIRIAQKAASVPRRGIAQ